jgi:hypothetical protein
VIPVDDPTWPECQEHKQVGCIGPTHWCEWTRDYLLEGKDADRISTGLRYAVPIVPVYGQYAQVAIDTELIGGVGAQMFLVKSNTYNFQETMIPLGLWTKGEGRLVMAKVIADWQLINTPDHCSKAAHGYMEEMQLQRCLNEPKTSSAVKAYRWHLAYHDCCTYCWERSQSTANAVTAAYTAAEVGLDPAMFKSNTSAQDRARNALQQQYGT